MKRNNYWRLAIVLTVLVWSLYEMYPPRGRDLVKQFQEDARVAPNDTTFSNIVFEATSLQKKNPDRAFANLEFAIGTNDIVGYFPEFDSRNEPHPTTYILNRLQRRAAGRITRSAPHRQTEDRASRLAQRRVQTHSRHQRCADGLDRRTIARRADPPLAARAGGEPAGCISYRAGIDRFYPRPGTSTGTPRSNASFEAKSALVPRLSTTRRSLVNVSSEPSSANPISLVGIGRRCTGTAPTGRTAGVAPAPGAASTIRLSCTACATRNPI